MLLTIKAQLSPGEDFGYLLHKHPARCHSFPSGWGAAHVFFPQISETSCTVALILDIDPISLVRTKDAAGRNSFSLDQYVNDRPYVASSFLSLTLAKVFHTALRGNCQDRPELPQTILPFEVAISALPCRGKDGEELLRSLFEPLGYQVEVERHLLDETVPEWGDASFYSVILKRCCLLKELLAHLYVLIPVLDDEKHYWITEAEIDKLLRYGEGWLSTHPKQTLIVDRYLKRQKHLTSVALERLLGSVDEEESDEAIPLPLSHHRMDAVEAQLKIHQAVRILDLGCGSGALLRRLHSDGSIEFVLGVDVSHRELERARKRLHYEEMSERQKARIGLLQSSLTYTDKRFLDFDAATLVEVIEHLDPARLSVMEYVVFGYAQPRMVVITTPNAEYNKRLGSFDGYRHEDHRFEWTRAQFQSWAHRVAAQYGYTVTHAPIGPFDDELGSPTQMGTFVREDPNGK